jgi:hypothetical protein
MCSQSNMAKSIDWTVGVVKIPFSDQNSFYAGNSRTALLATDSEAL